MRLTISTPIDPRCLPAWRRQMGFTQAQVAKLAGSNINDVSRLERALQPGELLDRMISALTALAADADAKIEEA